MQTKRTIASRNASQRQTHSTPGRTAWVVLGLVLFAAILVLIVLRAQDTTSGEAARTPSHATATPTAKTNPSPSPVRNTQSQPNAGDTRKPAAVLKAVTAASAASAPVESAPWDLKYAFPPDARIVDVKRDFGAKGDGVADDTSALRDAIKTGIDKTSRYASPCFVYLPEGTYRVTDVLESKVANDGWSGGWRSGMILVGQSRTGTVIRLDDKATGYGDPAKPKWVIATGSESDQRGPGLDGGGNRAFRHSIINLTVDVGAGNPGAIGIDYVANNRGCIERVTIRAPEGSGYCGLRLERHWPGPALVKFLRIEGFDYAMRVEHYQYSMTFEHIEISGQKKAGIRNTNNVLSFRDLKSVNRVPVFQVTGGHGWITLLDSTFSGGEANTSAIETKGRFFIRNLRCEGYGKVLDDQEKSNQDIEGGATKTVEEFASGGPKSLFDSPGHTLNLPVEETPEFHTDDLAQWESVTAHGATPAGGDESKGANNDDDAPAIQDAIDAGKPVVYLPNGNYAVRQTIVVRGKVRKIIGLQSGIHVPKGVSVDPMIRFEGGELDAVVLEHLRLGGTIEHASKKTLSLRHVDFDAYRNTADGTGNVFFEDTIGKPILIHHPQHAWGRQVNCEFGEKPLIENHAGTLWLLGFKTEGEMTCIETVGATTELLGAMLYPLRDGKANVPCFINDRARVSMCYRMNGKDYPIHVKERRGEEWRQLPAKSGRGQTLFVGQ